MPEYKTNTLPLSAYNNLSEKRESLYIHSLYEKRNLETQDMRHVPLGFVFLAKWLVLYNVAQENLGQGSTKARVGDFRSWKQQDKLKDDSNNAQSKL